MKPLQRAFFERDTIIVAKDLLGKIICRINNGQLLTGMIVETEGYTSNDPACHAFKGKTNRNAALFGPVGHAYVYFIYGNHFCLNFVSRGSTVLAGGVLIRAIEPINGINIMQSLRPVDEIQNLTSGPGKLTQAFGIDRTLNGVELMESNQLWVIENPTLTEITISESPRIGIKQAQDTLWRFYIAGNKFVSV